MPPSKSNAKRSYSKRVPSTLPPTTSKIPRPGNAWIFFRKEMLPKYKEMVKKETARPPKQAQASTTISRWWAELTAEERAPYNAKAQAAKEEHRLKYPDYKYSPMKAEDKQRLAEEKARVARQKKAASSKLKAASSKSRSSAGEAGAPPFPSPPAPFQGPLSIGHPATYSFDGGVSSSGPNTPNADSVGLYSVPATDFAFSENILDGHHTVNLCDQMGDYSFGSSNAIMGVSQFDFAPVDHSWFQLQYNNNQLPQQDLSGLYIPPNFNTYSLY